MGTEVRLSGSVIVATTLVLAASWQWLREPGVPYVTAKVMSGGLVVTVTATGNLQPRKQIEVGSEISGIVRTLHVDVNDRVKAGQVLAVLDTARLRAQLRQAMSAITSAEARVLQADAGRKEATANHARLLEVHELSGNRLPARQDLDFAEAAVARAHSRAAAARAAVAQARATRQSIETDLSKSEIRSPIDGVVLARSIEPGQTVAASLHAPVLFIVAHDLRELELHVALDQADVSAVRDGQGATFTVDAYPDQQFEARITRIHLASSKSSPSNAGVGVVTYDTVLEVANPQLLLRPGMTATATITTDRISATTLVPTAAMRFVPDHAEFPRVENGRGRGIGIFALVPNPAGRWKCPRENGQALGCVWILQNGAPVLAIFKPGASDRSMTQVLDLDRLPNWRSLSRLRGDPVLTRAMRLELTPGLQVIVDSKDRAHGVE